MSLLFSPFSEANKLSGLVECQGRIQTLKLIFHFEIYYLHTLGCNIKCSWLHYMKPKSELTIRILMFCSTLDNYSCCLWKRSSSSCLWLAKFPFYPITNCSDFSVNWSVQYNAIILLTMSRLMKQPLKNDHSFTLHQIWLWDTV